MQTANQHRGQRGVTSAPPLRVAAVVATADVSGPGRQLVALGRELQRRGVVFTILLLTRPGIPRTFPAFAAEQGIECRQLADRGPVDPQLVRDMRAFIESWHPDVVETHSDHLVRRQSVAADGCRSFAGARVQDRLTRRKRTRNAKAAKAVAEVLAQPPVDLTSPRKFPGGSSR